MKIDKPLRVIQIVDSLNAGGTEMMAVNIANALDRIGVESFLCATRKEGSLKSKINKNVRIFNLKRSNTFDFFAILRLKKIIKKYKINVIHSHHTSYFVASIIKILYPKVKLIWHDHNGNSEYLQTRKKFPLVFFSRYFDVVISVNGMLKKWAEDNLKAKKVFYLPNFASFSNSFQKTILKGNNDKRVVCLAGLRPQKDHLNLLKAFKIVQKKHQDWTLHLVGNHYNDAYYRDIKSFIKLNNFQSKIFLYHDSVDVENILNQATIGVLSSHSEGLPVALLEYGLAKLPVVITRVGECENVLKSGELGLLISASNEKELAEAIEKLIRNSALRTHFSKQFYKHIVENYSEKNICHKLIQIYKS